MFPVDITLSSSYHQTVPSFVASCFKTWDFPYIPTASCIHVLFTGHLHSQHAEKREYVQLELQKRPLTTTSKLIHHQSSLSDPMHVEQMTKADKHTKHDLHLLIRWILCL